MKGNIVVSGRGQITLPASMHFLTGDRRHFGPYMNKPKDTMGIVVQAVGDFLSDITK